LANDGVRTPIRLAVTAAETAVACGDATLASRVVRALDGRETPRAEYAAGLVRIALGGRPAPGSLARAAALVAADGWAYESARMLLTAAVALGRVRDARDEAIGLADAARQAFGALDLPAWGRRAGAALRRAGSTAQAGGASHARGLSGRELEVLRLVASGASNREVAERLVISEKTAARHMANIFGKLGARRRADAVRIAIERGLLGHEGPPA
jgi:DNA-binding CsgD family transcriptional regulator